MKIYPAILICAVLIGCGPVNKNAQLNGSGNEISAKCPNDGTCTFKVNENMAMIVTDSPENSINKVYKLAPDNTKTVIVYTYLRNVPKGVQDGSYREEIVFEIDKGKKSVEIADLSESTKILFGRFCYCKGYTGYYRISKGELKMKTKGNAKYFHLNFKVDDLPQVLETIDFTVK